MSAGRPPGVEFHTFTVLARCARTGRLGIATACLLAVSDTFAGGERRRIDDEDLAAAAERLGAVRVRIAIRAQEDVVAFAEARDDVDQVHAENVR